MHQMTDYTDLTVLLKILTTERPAMLAALLSFNKECISRTTRQSDHLALFKSRTKHGKKTIVYRASQLYNKHCAPKPDQHRYSSAMHGEFIRVAVGEACFLTIAFILYYTTFFSFFFAFVLCCSFFIFCSCTM